MQISRHWRMKANRYRLEGVKTANGDVRLNNRMSPPALEKRDEHAQPMLMRRETVSAGR